MAVLAAPGAVAQQRAPARTANVIYLGRDWLFIDAGWGEGLRQGSEVVVECSAPLPLAADGEPLVAATRLQMRVRAGALRAVRA